MHSLETMRRDAKARKEVKTDSMEKDHSRKNAVKCDTNKHDDSSKRPDSSKPNVNLVKHGEHEAREGKIEYDVEYSKPDVDSVEQDVNEDPNASILKNMNEDPHATSAYGSKKMTRIAPICTADQDGPFTPEFSPKRRIPQQVVSCSPTSCNGVCSAIMSPMKKKKLYILDPELNPDFMDPLPTSDSTCAANLHAYAVSPKKRVSITQSPPFSPKKVRVSPSRASLSPKRRFRKPTSPKKARRAGLHTGFTKMLDNMDGRLDRAAALLELVSLETIEKKKCLPVKPLLWSGNNFVRSESTERSAHICIRQAGPPVPSSEPLDLVIKRAVDIWPDYRLIEDDRLWASGPLAKKLECLHVSSRDIAECHGNVALLRKRIHAKLNRGRRSSHYGSLAWGPASEKRHSRPATSEERGPVRGMKRVPSAPAKCRMSLPSQAQLASHDPVSRDVAGPSRPSSSVSSRQSLTRDESRPGRGKHSDTSKPCREPSATWHGLPHAEKPHAWISYAHENSREGEPNKKTSEGDVPKERSRAQSLSKLQLPKHACSNARGPWL